MKRNFRAILAILLSACVLSGCNIVVDDGGSSGSTGSQQSDNSNSSSSTTSQDVSSGDTSSTSSTTTSSSSSSTTTEPVDPDKDPNEGEMSGTVLVTGDGRGLVCFYGNNEGAERYANYLNQYKENLGDSVNVYTLVSPTAGTYYMPEKYKKSLGVSDEKAVIAHIGECLNGVENVNVCEIFEEHKNEHIFSSTDHHWQQLGAFYAAQEFARIAGVPFEDLSNYEKVVLEGYVGTLYGYSKENPKSAIIPRSLCIIFPLWKPPSPITP